MMHVPRPRGSVLWLGLAPLLLVSGFAAWFISDRLVIIGPFDRAQIGWAVVVPLLALAPGAAALAERRAARVPRSRLVVVAVSLGIGAFVLVGLSATVTFLDCRPVSGPLDVIPRALPTAVIAGLAFVIAVAAATGPARFGRSAVALLVGAGAWLVVAAIGLLVFAASFAPLSCAAPPG